MFCVTCGLKMSDDMAACPRCGNERAIRESFSKQPDSSAAQSKQQVDDPAVQSSKQPDSSAAQSKQQVDDPVVQSSKQPDSPLFATTDYGPAVNLSKVPPSSPSYNSNSVNSNRVNSYNVMGPPFYAPAPPIFPVAPLPQPYLFPPPVQPSKRSNNKLFFIIGSVLLVFFVLCGALVYLEIAMVSISMKQILVHMTPTALQDQSTEVANSDPSQNPYPPQTGILIMNDPMHDNSKGYKWDETTLNSNNGKAFCGYKFGNYHMTRSARGSLICNPEAAQMTLSNLAFEVTTTAIQGKDVGLVTRFDPLKGTGYLFLITSNGLYAIYAVDLSNNDVNKHYVVLGQGSNETIKQGLNQSNTLALVADGSSISAFVNHQLVDSVQNTLFVNGQIGIYSSSDAGEDVVVQNARVWRI